jgi:hypothetical protein
LDTKPNSTALAAFIPSALLTLLTGGIMMTGGYVFANDGWALAGPIMIPAGPLISLAFALARPKDRAVGPPDRKARTRHIVSMVIGLPSPGVGTGVVLTIVITVVTLLAGAVMVVAGYASAAWNLAFVPPLILASGGIITTAFVMADRVARATAIGAGKGMG